MSVFSFKARGNFTYFEVLVSEEDKDLILKYTWNVKYCKSKVMAVYTRSTPGRKNLYLHRLITNPPKSVVIDHIDGNPLNNTRSNLRFATHKQNLANRSKTKSNTSGYKGVYNRRRGVRPWYAQIKVNGKTQGLGSFETPEEAHEAYKKAAQKFCGEFAKA